MLLILLIAVPAGIGLAVLLEFLEHHGERMETWIEDSHPLFARPGSDRVGAAIRVASTFKALRPGTTRAQLSEHRRAA